jgi:hypothetical protein
MPLLVADVVDGIGAAEEDVFIVTTLGFDVNTVAL